MEQGPGLMGTEAGVCQHLDQWLGLLLGTGNTGVPNNLGCKQQNLCVLLYSGDSTQKEKKVLLDGFPALLGGRKWGWEHSPTEKTHSCCSFLFLSTPAFTFLRKSRASSFSAELLKKGWSLPNLSERQAHAPTIVKTSRLFNIWQEEMLPPALTKPPKPCAKSGQTYSDIPPFLQAGFWLVPCQVCRVTKVLKKRKATGI